MMITGFGCQQRIFQPAPPPLDDAAYKSEFSQIISNSEMEKVAGSVKKLFCIVEYEVYQFEEKDQLTREKLGDLNLRRSNAQKTTFNETVYGTATILQNNRNGILLLTCAHIVDNPDTLISYFQTAASSSIIESVAIKKSQMNFIRDNENNNLLRIFAFDSKLDLAFLGSDKVTGIEDMPVFEIGIGNGNILQWGTPVYVMGFPGGHQMLTNAAVGNPHSTPTGDFIIDASFNPGGSGSMIMAVNQTSRKLEFVGIAKSASATFINTLKPEKESHQEIYNPNLPYDGNLYVKRVRNINYGITFAISVNTIRDFYIQHRKSLNREGFGLDEFFGLK